MSERRLDILIEVRAEVLREVLRWRSYIPILAEAVERVFGTAEVYVFGSAVRGGLTVDSDIDVLVVLEEVPGSGLERARLLDMVWRYMEERGVPWWYPFEIHLVTRRELEMMRRAGERLVDVKTIAGAGESRDERLSRRPE